jgi:predicted DNA-binding transcriptional regulator AlpA
MEGIKMINNNSLRPKTVKLIRRLLTPWVDEGVITVTEENVVLSNLKHLADKGELRPLISPKLIDQKEAATMLGIGHSNFKKLEREGAFPFKRKMVGTAVRYRNLDMIDYMIQ